MICAPLNGTGKVAVTELGRSMTNWAAPRLKRSVVLSPGSPLPVDGPAAFGVGVAVAADGAAAPGPAVGPAGSVAISDTRQGSTVVLREDGSAKPGRAPAPE